MMPLFLEECDVCLCIEERVFEDTWTGTNLCLDCLSSIVRDITNSPCSEGDNLEYLIESVLYV